MIEQFTYDPSQIRASISMEKLALPQEVINKISEYPNIKIKIISISIGNVGITFQHEKELTKQDLGLGENWQVGINHQFTFA